MLSDPHKPPHHTPAVQIQLVRVDSTLGQLTLDELDSHCPGAHELCNYKLRTWLPPCWREPRWVENIEDDDIRAAAYIRTRPARYGLQARTSVQAGA